MVLLWVLFFCQLVLAILLYGQAWAYMRDASTLDAKEPGMRATFERTKDRIQKETDIARLQSMALSSYSLNYAEWRDRSYRYHNGSATFLDAATLLTIVSAVLLSVIYALRNKHEAGKGIKLPD